MSTTSEAVERVQQYVEARTGRVGLDPELVHALDGHTYELRLADLRVLVDLAALLLPELRLHARALVDGLEGDLGLAKLVLERLDDYGVEQ